MSKHVFPLTGRPRCKYCGELEAVELNVSTDGYSVTARHQHKPECPELRCPHGVLWQEDCAACDIERAEQGE